MVCSTSYTESETLEYEQLYASIPTVPNDYVVCASDGSVVSSSTPPSMSSEVTTR